jgi:hypothetical protein
MPLRMARTSRLRQQHCASWSFMILASPARQLGQAEVQRPAMERITTKRQARAVSPANGGIPNENAFSLVRRGRGNSKEGRTSLSFDIASLAERVYKEAADARCPHHLSRKTDSPTPSVKAGSRRDSSQNSLRLRPCNIISLTMAQPHSDQRPDVQTIGNSKMHVPATRSADDATPPAASTMASFTLSQGPNSTRRRPTLSSACQHGQFSGCLCAIEGAEVERTLLEALESEDRPIIWVQHPVYQSRFIPNMGSDVCSRPES